MPGPAQATGKNAVSFAQYLKVGASRQTPAGRQLTERNDPDAERPCGFLEMKAGRPCGS